MDAAPEDFTIDSCNAASAEMPRPPAFRSIELPAALLELARELGIELEPRPGEQVH